MRRLAGRIVATTRDGRPDDTLVLALRAEGADVRVWPTLRIEEPEDAAPLEAAVAAVGRFDWITFTSARAVEAMSARAGAPGARPRVAAVGHATAEALTQRGWRVDLVGPGGGAAGLVDALAAAGVGRGARILFPAGSLARDVLQEGLGSLGAEVVRVVAYRTVPTPPDAALVRGDVATGAYLVTFASPSAVQALDQALGGHHAAVLAPCTVVAIGPTTAEAVRAAGRTRVRVAGASSVEALLEACIEACLGAAAGGSR
jgi:uroporphyrinogen-III synthase